MRRYHQFAGLLALLTVTACGGDPAPPPPVAVLPTPEVAPASVAPAALVEPAVDAGTALAEARRCGRAIAVAARCNFMRDDRDVAALRFAVLQGLDQRYGAVVDEPRLTEAVDLAVLDRMATIGQCTIPSRDLPVVQSGLRDVLGTCAAP